MKSIYALTALASAAFLVTGCHQKANLSTDDQKLSYGIGLDMGGNFKKQGLTIDPDALAAGLRDGQSGAPQQVAQEEIQKIMMAKQQELMAKQQADGAAASAKSKADSDAFLAANKTKDGVQTTASGLQYKVLKAGTGKKPASDSIVTVNYKGSLVDGTEFDASQPGKPVDLPINGVIPGWTEGLQLMTEGSTYEFYIPANLAYGDQGAGQGRIPGGAALVFQVDLIKVNPAGAKAAGH